MLTFAQGCQEPCAIPSDRPDAVTGHADGLSVPGLDPWRPRLLIVCGTLAAMLLMPVVVGGQDVTAPALKAAFIYNFIKFTEWPVVAPASDPFVMCVMGDAAVGDALDRVVDGRALAGRRMVTLVTDSRPTQTCHVLYMSGVSPGEAALVIAGLQDSAVLTISDVPGFKDAGGHAQLFFERGQLRFRINVESVKRSKLKMSSRLLSLGKQ